MSHPYLLMTPGPVQIPALALQEMSLPMIHHRTPEFERILDSVLKKLQSIFVTENRVFIHAATGSGGMESALVNTISPGEKIISVNCGKFGERWIEIAKSYGIQVIEVKVPWGEAVRPQQVEDCLKQYPDARAVLIQACETSTAILNPIREVAEIVRKHPNTLMMVDAITALGQIDLPMDDWGLDVVVAASQKALMLPTGLALVSFSKKAWPFVETSRSPRCYFDIRKEKKANQASQTYFSSAVSLIRGLNVVCDLILKDGVPANVRKFTAFSQAVRAGGEALGCQVFSKAPSPSVTALLVPAPLDGEKVRAHLEEKYRITIAGGQDQLKGKAIRIGHMGDISGADILRTMDQLAQTFCDLGFNADRDKAVSAVRSVLGDSSKKSSNS